MSNSEPYEVIAGKITAWVAEPDTAFPDLNAAPGVGWTLVGTNGAQNYNESGLIMRHPQTITPFRALGATGTRKNFRENEDLEFEFVVVDFTVEQLAIALGIPASAIIDTPAASGVPGDKFMPLLRGFTVDTKALLLRLGQSPYGSDFEAQYEIPWAQQVGAPEPTMTKGTPLGYQHIWRTLEHPTEGFGGVRMQDAAAL